MEAAAGHTHATILDRMPDGFVELSDESVILYANPGVERLLGRPRAELVGHAVDHVFPETVLESMRTAYAAAHSAAEDVAEIVFEAKYEPTGAWLRICVTKSEDTRSVFLRDVTERRKAASIASEAEAKYRMLVEQLPFIVYIDALDLRSSNIYTSPQTTEMLGYTPEEWAEDPDLFIKILHPGDRARMEADLAQANAKGEPSRAEYRLRAKDGRVVSIRDDSVVVRDADGNPLFRQGFLIDQTERRQTERALVEAERRYRSLVEQSPLGIYSNDPDGKMLYASPQVAQITGYRAEEFVSDPGLFWKLLHPDDYEVVKREMERAVATESDFRLEYRMFHADGRVVWILDRTSPVRGIDGRTIYRQGFVADITEEKLRAEALAVSEERFRRSFENASIGITMTGPDGTYIDVNPAFCEMVGRSREELLEGGYRDITYPEDLPVDLAGDHAMLTGEIQSSVAEKRYVRPDGELVWVLMSISLVCGSDGEPLHFVCQAQDVTERRRLEDELRQSQKMEAVGRLAGGVAHDFNNLLTAISGYGEFLMSRHAPDERDYQDAAQITKSAERAAELTAQLLAFSRRQVLQPRVFAFDDAVGDLEDLLRRLLGEHLDVTVSLRSEGAHVRADRSQIDQVVVNLAVNARDAMPEGGSLEIETSVVELPDAAHAGVELPAGRYALLSVSDTGMGMDEQTAAQVFEPFFTTKAVGDGTGLGLATVYGIVKQSDGDVAVESVPDEGTTFRVYLPLAHAPAEPGAGTPQPGAEPGSETILLTEDEDVVRALVREILTGRGYEVLEAANPDEALAVSRNHPGPVHLLLTDVVMPGMNGRTLAERLAAERPGLRVLYTSGYANGRIGSRGDLGSASFIQKPFAADELAAKVREVLDSARAAAA